MRCGPHCEQVKRADRLGTLGTLAAGLAHEINNPLVSIHTFLSLAPQKRSEPDEHFWGERPDFYRGVYGWSDYRVLEENGRITACAGLWDRGRDVRERWRPKETGNCRFTA